MDIPLCWIPGALYGSSSVRPLLPLVRTLARILLFALWPVVFHFIRRIQPCFYCTIIHIPGYRVISATFYNNFVMRTKPDVEICRNYIIWRAAERYLISEPLQRRLSAQAFPTAAEHSANGQNECCGTWKNSAARAYKPSLFAYTPILSPFKRRSNIRFSEVL